MGPCNGFHEVFFKVQHREEENCDDYFLRLGIQKIWHVKLSNKVANVLAIIPIKKIGSTKNIFR